MEKAHELGLSDTKLLTKEKRIQSLEPHTTINGLGAIHFNCDAHCWPTPTHATVTVAPGRNPLPFLKAEEVIKFEKSNGRVTKVITTNNAFTGR